MRKYIPLQSVAEWIAAGFGLRVVPSLGTRWYVCEKHRIFGCVQHALIAGTLEEIIDWMILNAPRHPKAHLFGYRPDLIVCDDLVGESGAA